MKVFADTRNMDHQTWLETRKLGIGGSDAPAIMGVDNYRTQFEVWMEKTGIFEEDSDSEPAEWGRRLEEMLAQKFMEDTGKKLVRKNAVLQHKDYPFMLANVDRLVQGEDAGWEGKTTNYFYNDDGSCPQRFWVQCQHYLAVTGRSKWYVSVLAGGQKYYQYEVERDDEYIHNHLIPQERWLWELIQTGDPPPVDGSDAAKDMLGEMYPEAVTEEPLELPEMANHYVQQYQEAKEREKQAKADAQEASNILKSYLCGYSIGIAGDKKVFWKSVTQTKLDTKTLKEKEPEVYERYQKTSSHRRFEIR